VSTPQEQAKKQAQKKKRRSQPVDRRALLRILIGITTMTLMSVWAVWPIYETGRVWVVAIVAASCGVLLGFARRYVSVITLIALTLLTFILASLAVAVPSAFLEFPTSLGRAFVGIITAIVKGWKQLLTLDLPVGSYQAMLVPFLIVMLVSALAATLLRRSRLAAIPLAVPVVWGTVFGSVSVSNPVSLGPVTIVAPREVALWVITALGSGVWVWLLATSSRREALRRGGGGVRRAARPIAAVVSIALAIGLTAAVLPSLSMNERSVPREKVDPQIVVNEQPSSLAAYRESKSDDEIDRDLFTVSSDKRLPDRVTLVTLDTYDGTDFNTSRDGDFTRFPSGASSRASSDVTVSVDGYRGIWAPISAPLAGPPAFAGDRASKLGDSFYVNRETGTAVAVPTRAGLTRGDSYTVPMSTAPAPKKLGRPGKPQLNAEATPELATWLERQGNQNLADLIEKLRNTGYLSHALNKGGKWLEKSDVKFVSTPGGHSQARVDELFEQLNSTPDAVAGIGDDEQFAAAAALIARAVGYDSRVVLGFRLEEDVPGIPACDNTCTGENLAAWIEARGTNGQWVPFDVSPQIAEPPSTLQEGEKLPEFPTVPEERDAQPVDPPSGLGDQDDSDLEHSSSDRFAWLWPVLRITGLSLLGLLSLLVPVLCIPFAKWLRKKRRRNARGATARGLGAWNELRDRAIDAGAALPVTKRQPSGDPLSEGGGSRMAQARVIGTPNAEVIAQKVEESVYSSESMTLEEAGYLWDLVDEDLHAQKKTLFQSLRAAYALRSLGIGKQK
jgi:hypothetical protein